MSLVTFPTSGTSPDYWTCWRCNAPVPNGCTHHGPTTYLYPQSPPSPPPAPPLGWQCPVCKTVWAPSQWNCNRCLVDALTEASNQDSKPKGAA